MHYISNWKCISIKRWKVIKKSDKPTIISPKNTFIDDSVKFGKNVIIYEGNRLMGNTYIGDDTVLLPNNFIVDSKIGCNTSIHSSVIENSIIDDNIVVGPFARIRPKSHIKSYSKIGNFCEVKNSNIGKYTKMSHLAYVGDSEIGDNCNIGCGVIFANYNGKTKSGVKVGNNVFIGSNSNLIAPLEIGDGVYICAGTTVVHNCDSDSFIIGRARAVEKKSRAHDYLKGVE